MLQQKATQKISSKVKNTHTFNILDEILVVNN